MIASTTPNIFGLTEPAPLSLETLLINLLLGAVLAYGLAWHYIRFGKTNSNRAELAQVFPIIVMATILIISVVKSSLALSLGLVGALSIVRFRTPIKEPEELGYLFIAIAIGLGFGADQRQSTAIAIVCILVVLAVVRQLPGQLKPAKHMLYCNIETPLKGETDNDIQHIHAILKAHTQQVDMRRVDVRDGMIHGTYLIQCLDNHALLTLMDTLQKLLPEAAVSFVDQKGPLGI